MEDSLEEEKMGFRREMNIELIMILIEVVGDLQPKRRIDREDQKAGKLIKFVWFNCRSDSRGRNRSRSPRRSRSRSPYGAVVSNGRDRS